MNLDNNQLACECCDLAKEKLRRTDDGVLFSNIGWHPPSKVLVEISFCPCCGRRLSFAAKSVADEMVLKHGTDRTLAAWDVNQRIAKAVSEATRGRI